MSMNADLHMHGPIGFQPYWLRKQGYAGKNLLQLLTDQAIKVGIDICAVTSQKKEFVPRGSESDDRLGILLRHEAPLLPLQYHAGTLGGDNNVIVVQKENKKVYFVNGQTVMPSENGRDYDLLVIGSNAIPSGMNFEDTMKYCADRGLPTGAEHPLVESHRGMGEDLLRKHIDQFTVIEGHNSQAIFPQWIAEIPLIGNIFSRAGKELNKKAQEIADQYRKPWIATSDAHRIEDLGLSYISITTPFNDKDEEKFIGWLRESLQTHAFSKKTSYANPLTWARWVYTFQRGIRSKDLIDEYIPSNHLT